MFAKKCVDVASVALFCSACLPIGGILNHCFGSYTPLGAFFWSRHQKKWSLNQVHCSAQTK